MTQCEWSVKVNWGWMNSLPARAVPASGALRLLHHSIQSHSISVKFTEMSWLNYIPFIHVAHSGTSFVISFLLSGTFIHYVHSLFTPLIRLQLINYVHYLSSFTRYLLSGTSFLPPSLRVFHSFNSFTGLNSLNWIEITCCAARYSFINHSFVYVALLPLHHFTLPPLLYSFHSVSNACSVQSMFS